MIFLLITMFNLLVGKAKKIMDSHSSSSTVLSSMKSNPIIFDKDIDDIQLKETIFGNNCSFTSD